MPAVDWRRCPETGEDADAPRVGLSRFKWVARPEERLRLWRQGFSPKARLEPAVDLDKLAKEHTLSGGAIMNVIRYASLQALQRDSEVVLLEDVLQGIRREYAKERKGE